MYFHLVLKNPFAPLSIVIIAKRVCKKSDLHLKSPRFTVALGIFLCYTLKIEGSEESSLKIKLL